MSDDTALRRRLKAAVKHLWPAGPTRPDGSICMEQFTDIVMVFIMGWYESLRELDTLEARNLGVEDKAVIMEIIDSFSGPGWAPDESWYWWENPENAGGDDDD